MSSSFLFDPDLRDGRYASSSAGPSSLYRCRSSMDRRGQTSVMRPRSLGTNLGSASPRGRNRLEPGVLRRTVPGHRSRFRSVRFPQRLEEQLPHRKWGGRMAPPKPTRLIAAQNRILQGRKWPERERRRTLTESSLFPCLSDENPPNPTFCRKDS